MSPPSPTEHLKAQKFLRFAVVGGLATALHWTVAALLLMADMQAVMASTVGFVVSAGFNLAANARYTFNAEAVTGTHAWRFMASAGIGCLLNGSVVHLAMSMGLPVPLSQVLATGLVLVWNFVLNALWVFRDPKSAVAATSAAEPTR